MAINGAVVVDNNITVADICVTLSVGRWYEREPLHVSLPDGLIVGWHYILYNSLSNGDHYRAFACPLLDLICVKIVVLVMWIHFLQIKHLVDKRRVPKEWPCVFKRYMICPTGRTEKKVMCTWASCRHQEWRKDGKEHCPILRKACIIYCATKQPTWETTRYPLYAYAWCFVCWASNNLCVCMCVGSPFMVYRFMLLVSFPFFLASLFLFFFLSLTLLAWIPNPPLLLPFIILLLSWLIVLSGRHITTSQN